MLKTRFAFTARFYIRGGLRDVAAVARLAEERRVVDLVQPDDTRTPRRSVGRGILVILNHLLKAAYEVLLQSDKKGGCIKVAGA